MSAKVKLCSKDQLTTLNPESKKNLTCLHRKDIKLDKDCKFQINLCKSLLTRLKKSKVDVCRTSCVQDYLNEVVTYRIIHKF
jgi:hypothetical protein